MKDGDVVFQACVDKATATVMRDLRADNERLRLLLAYAAVWVPPEVDDDLKGRCEAEAGVTPNQPAAFVRGKPATVCEAIAVEINAMGRTDKSPAITDPNATKRGIAD